MGGNRFLVNFRQNHNFHSRLFAAFARQNYLLPGLTAGIFARSGGSLSGSKASTLSEIRLTNGTPKLHRAVGAIHNRRHAGHVAAMGADDVNRFLHAAALGHDVLDDEHFFAGRNFESAPQHEFALLFFAER